MKKLLFSALAGLLVVSISTQADAQKKKKKKSSEATQEKLPPFAPERNMIELGASMGMFFPSGKHELYDPTAGPYQQLDSVAFDLGVRAAYFPLPFVGIEMEGGFSPTTTRATGDGVSIFKVRGHVMGQYPKWPVVPFIVMGYGTMISSSDALGNDNDGAFHWGIGGKYFLSNLIGVRLDGRHIVSGARDTIGQPESNPLGNSFELTAGIIFTFNRSAEEDPDPDGDGIRGAQDKCPNDKGVPPDGCPGKDSDGDGVKDHADQCPLDPGKAIDGCPLPDGDGDGLPDKDDACPHDPANTPDGCPDPDPDRDGVAKDRDKCPDQPGIEPDGCPDPDPDKDGVIGDADKCPDEGGLGPDGCPIADTDGDGVPDDVDRCADQAAPGSEDGCPAEGAKPSTPAEEKPAEEKPAEDKPAEEKKPQPEG